MRSNFWSQYLAEVAAAGVEKEPLAWDQTLESAADNGYDGANDRPDIYRLSDSIEKAEKDIRDLRSTLERHQNDIKTIKEDLSQNMDYIESLTTWSKELFNKVNGVFASRPKAPQVK